LEFNKVAKQSNGAVLLKVGNAVIMASVVYNEFKRASAAGEIDLDADDIRANDDAARLSEGLQRAISEARATERNLQRRIDDLNNEPIPHIPTIINLTFSSVRFDLNCFYLD